MKWPGTLFGRLLLVLGSGLLVAQLLSAAINLAERDRLLSSSFGQQPAQRVADVVRLLDGMDAGQRQALLAVFRTPPLVLSLQAGPIVPADAATAWPAQMFTSRLQSALGEPREVRVQAREGFASTPISNEREGHRGPRMGMGGGMGPGMGPGGTHRGGMPVVRIEAQLRDGTWARFDTELPNQPDSLPWRLALTLAVLLATVLVLSFIAVRWVVRPLQQLTAAAQALGEDLNRPPLPETGPREVQQAARAFNTMQQRLAAFVNERTRMLTALSHDLKTPLTRMRLRTDLMDDDEQRQRFEADLKEMEAMVSETLDFMRGLGGHEALQPVDLNALAQALQADQQAMGRPVQVQGQAHSPLMAMPSLLKRALGNLLDNAALYGGNATLALDDSATTVTLRVADDGPGIPAQELERVFEPFYRLEASRNRSSGGTGLGLGIARNIARAHGGELTLHNRATGGLEAVLTLPRRTPAAGR
ncbi:MAG TPA: ATP-binding protein [Rubrivivax sp.]|nr:ATP-binding protein [Rubrivivax sp.]